MTSTQRAGTPPAPRRKGRGWIIVLAVIVGLLLLVQFGASPVATAMVNRKLSEIEGFSGSIERINLAIWRGTVEAHGFVLRDSDHPDDIPVVSIRRAVMTGGIRPLLSGKLGGSARIEGAEVTIIKRERMEDPGDEAADKMKETREQVKRWQHALRETFPMEITEVEATDGRMRFIDRSYDPVVDVEVAELHTVIQNLRNQPDGEDLPTTIDITGVTTGGGQLEIHVETDPLKEPLEFETTFEIRDLSLPEFNDFMLAYAKVDVSQGTFDVYIEATAEDGAYQGYVKPFFEDLDFTGVEDENKSLGRRIVETVASAATSLLENPESDKVATQTPFSGTFDENDVDLWSTLENLLSNAFLQAIREGLEGWSGSD